MPSKHSLVFLTEVPPKHCDFLNQHKYFIGVLNLYVDEYCRGVLI